MTNPPATLATIYDQAIPPSPRFHKYIVSIPKAEKVVNPPRKPVTKKYLRDTPSIVRFSTT